MEDTPTQWRALVGKFVILNSFGILQIQGVAGDQLLVGDADATTAIPLAVIHSVQALGDAAIAGPGRTATLLA